MSHLEAVWVIRLTGAGQEPGYFGPAACLQDRRARSKAPDRRESDRIDDDAAVVGR